MTPEAAIYGFLSRFGIPAFAATSVPDGQEFPYITYVMSTGSFWDGEIQIEADVWYRGDGETEPNAKARQISEAIGGGGVVLPCDGGAIWLKRGAPFSQSMGDSSDDRIKRRYLIILAEFITI